MESTGKRKLAAGAVLVLLALWALWASESRLGLSLEHALKTRLRSQAMVTTLEVDGVGAVPLFLHPTDQIMTPEMWAGRLWEKTETTWFLSSLRPGDVVVDVGANVGYYTVLAGLLVGDTGRVYAFEPDPQNFELLRRNVALNGLHNVILENKAASNEAGQLSLYLDEENKGDHRIYQPEGEQRRSIDVEAVRLDDYFEGVEDSVDFVKIDTQGAEFAILEGALGILARSPGLVMAVEYSPEGLAGFGASGGDLVDLLETLDLEMFDLGLGGPNLYPIRPIDSSSLRRFPKKTWFTNLLLLRARPDLLEKIERSVPRDPGT